MSELYIFVTFSASVLLERRLWGFFEHLYRLWKDESCELANFPRNTFLETIESRLIYKGQKILTKRGISAAQWEMKFIVSAAR